MKIYCIENKLNGKKYVGMTKGSLKNRFNKHKSIAKSDRKKQHLHKALIKDGVENFFIYELDFAENFDDLKQKEIEWIKKLDTKNVGYNETNGGEGIVGYKMSEEQKKVLSEKAKQRFSKLEEREKLSKKSKEWYESLSKKEKEEISKKLSLKLIGNQRAKGKKYTRSAEYRKKMSESKQGIPRSDQVKKILSDKARERVGWKHSPETIEKMRKSAKNRKRKEESVGT